VWPEASRLVEPPCHPAWRVGCGCLLLLLLGPAAWLPAVGAILQQGKPSHSALHHASFSIANETLRCPLRRAPLPAASLQLASSRTRPTLPDVPPPSTTGCSLFLRQVPYHGRDCEHERQLRVRIPTLPAVVSSSACLTCARAPVALPTTPASRGEAACGRGAALEPLAAAGARLLLDGARLYGFLHQKKPTGEKEEEQSDINGTAKRSSNGAAGRSERTSTRSTHWYGSLMCGVPPQRIH
jgi:hypothetical protein